MKTISENYNGKVKSTANQGFSVLKSANKINAEVKKLGFSTEKQTAKTGTIYMNLYDINDIFIVKIRISNHTKRGIDTINTFEYTTDFRKKTVIEIVNICNTNMLHEFINNIPLKN